VTKKKYQGKNSSKFNKYAKKCETKNTEKRANKTENKANASEKKETC